MIVNPIKLHQIAGLTTLDPTLRLVAKWKSDDDKSITLLCDKNGYIISDSVGARRIKKGYADSDEQAIYLTQMICFDLQIDGVNLERIELQDSQRVGD